MIWEKLPKEPFSFDELNLMENTIIGLLSQPKNEQLAMCCLDAYQYFIDYIKNKFTEQLYLENSLKMLITYCNSMNNINTERKSIGGTNTIKKYNSFSNNLIEEEKNGKILNQAKRELEQLATRKQEIDESKALTLEEYSKLIQQFL